MFLKVVDEIHMQARVAEMACIDITPEASPEMAGQRERERERERERSEDRGSIPRENRESRESRQSTPGEVNYFFSF